MDEQQQEIQYLREIFLDAGSGDNRIEQSQIEQTYYQEGFEEAYKILK